MQLLWQRGFALPAPALATAGISISRSLAALRKGERVGAAQQRPVQWQAQPPVQGLPQGEQLLLCRLHALHVALTRKYRLGQRILNKLDVH